MSVGTITGRHSEILHPTTRALFQVWDTIRQGRSAPMRNELDLRAIRKLLANIALIERSPVKPSFSFRLAGTALRTIYGKELTGADFLGLWSNVEQTTMAEMAATVIAHHQPATVRFKGFAHDGRAEGIEMIMLPIMRTDRQETQIIAAIAPFTDPYWLGANPLVRSELISHRVILVDAHRTVDNRPQDVFAEEGRPLTAPVRHSAAPPRPLVRPGPIAGETGIHSVNTGKLQLIRGGIK